MAFAPGERAVCATDPITEEVEGPSRQAGAAAERRRTAPPGQPILRGVRPIALLVGVVTAVGALYLGRGFLMPVAVAGLLTFLLNPIVRLFERRLPRVAAVMLVVVLTFSVLGGPRLDARDAGRQPRRGDPQYRDNLKRKIADVRGASRGTVIEKVQSATKEVVEELQKEEKPPKPAEKPVPVVVKPAALPSGSCPSCWRRSETSASSSCW